MTKSKMPNGSSVNPMGTANRGKYLEEWIEQANQTYNARGEAVITKIPTPWKVQRNRQPFTKQYAIAYAYPEKKSTVDFGGTAAKKSIWFDVKATKHKTNFPLANIHQHQLDYLRQVHEQGGKAFIIVHSEAIQKTWLLWITDLLNFLATEKRKSLTWAWLDEHCEEITSGNDVLLDYLPLVLREEK
jgi:recombination protein U